MLEKGAPGNHCGCRGLLHNCARPLVTDRVLTRIFDNMMTSSKGHISALLALFVGNSPVNPPPPPPHTHTLTHTHKGQWRWALMFSLIWAWTNGWVNNREAGDLRHHRAHYDVTVMKIYKCFRWLHDAIQNGRRSREMPRPFVCKVIYVS